MSKGILGFWRISSPSPLTKQGWSPFACVTTRVSGFLKGGLTFCISLGLHQWASDQVGGLVWLLKSIRKGTNVAYKVSLWTVWRICRASAAVKYHCPFVGQDMSCLKLCYLPHLKPQSNSTSLTLCCKQSLLLLLGSSLCICIRHFVIFSLTLWCTSGHQRVLTGTIGVILNLQCSDFLPLQ